MNATGCTLIDADIDGRVTNLRFEGGRIASLHAPPRPGDRIVDLRGDRLLPGLVNAHDHLQLNVYPRLRYRPRYANASEWIEDIDARRHSDAELLRCAQLPRAGRLLHGALKNLLAGVTTVAHHDPFYEALAAPDFPLRVSGDYGWSHSLYVDGEHAVLESCARTPPGWPWIIHAGEGTDGAAAREFERLETLGCLRPNTLVVHGVGFGAPQLLRLRSHGAGLIWCPSSNLYLFGRTADVAALLQEHAVALGSDSRLSGERDFLAELRVAAQLAHLDDARLARMVTRDAARLLGHADRGQLEVSMLADLLVLPRGLSLAHASRAQVRAVLVGGRMSYGDAHYAAAFGDADRLLAVGVDGVPKLLDRSLAMRLDAAGIVEPGVEPESGAGWRAA
jgi:cytosine/adenosine deaminase-related metal-dependent hydrolase